MEARQGQSQTALAPGPRENAAEARGHPRKDPEEGRKRDSSAEGKDEPKKLRLDEPESRSPSSDRLPDVLKEQPNTPRTREVKKLVSNSSRGFQNPMRSRVQPLHR